MRNHRWRRAAFVAALLLLVAACTGAPGLTAQPQGTTVPAATLPAVTAVVIRSPTCSCCHEHEAYLRAAGLTVQLVIQQDVTTAKDAYGVPTAMRSCHTTDIGGYFVEGHVPMAAIEKLLAERPAIDGIALPGMPAGSPGMGGVPEGPLVVFAVNDGAVLGEFGSY